MQGTQVQPLVQEDPTSCGATRPVYHNYQAHTLEAATTRAREPRSLRWAAGRATAGRSLGTTPEEAHTRQQGPETEITESKKRWTQWKYHNHNTFKISKKPNEITKMKVTLNRHNSRMEMTKKGSQDLMTDQQTLFSLNNWENRYKEKESVSGLCGTVTKFLPFISSEPQKEER